MAWTVPNTFSQTPLYPAPIAQIADQDPAVAAKLSEMQSALSRKADVSAIVPVSEAIAGKADAGAVANALNGKADASAVDRSLSTLQTGLAGKADASALPKPASNMPMPEKTSPNMGASVRYALEDHQHGRLASATYGVTGADGITAAIMFTRTFVAMPTVTTCVVKNTGAVATVEVYDWIMGTGAQAGLYVGCYIIAKRVRVKSTKTEVVVLNISVLQKQDSIIEEYPAVGLVISVLAIARSDIA